MHFTARTDLGVTKIFTITGDVVASFAATSAGKLAYAAFRTGLTRTHCTLKDSDTDQFIIGTLDQLVD